MPKPPAAEEPLSARLWIVPCGRRPVLAGAASFSVGLFRTNFVVTLGVMI